MACTGTWTPPQLQPCLAFDGYTLVRELQARARSHIHLATDNQTGQQVVLKTPSGDLREQPAYLDRFLLEEWVARHLRGQQTPWIERDPVRFWRGLALLPALVVLALVARLAGAW